MPRRAASVLLVALAALLGLGAVAAPSSATPLASDAARATSVTPSPSTTSDDDALPVRVQITQVTPHVLRPGEDLVVRVRLTSSSDETIAQPRAVVRIEQLRPGSRADLRTWLAEPADGRRVGRATASVTSETPLAPGGSQDLEITVPGSRVGLLDRPDTWGARGLAVEATDGTSRRVGLQRSFVLWATDGDITQARVSLLAPVVGPATVPAGVDVTAPGPTLDALVAPGGRLAAMLQVARTSPDVALAVDPALLAGAREASDAAAAWAQGILATTVGRDVIALPWSDPDLAALAQGGAGDLLTAAVGATQAEVGTVQDGQQLAARTDVMWAPGPTTDQATADVAAQAGASVLVLAPGDAQDDDGTTAQPTRLTTPHGAVTGLVPDATLTTLLVDPTSLDPDATTATVVQRVLAELSVIARDPDDGPRHVLVAMPRDADPNPALVAAVAEAIHESPWARTATLAALLGASATTDDQLPTSQDDGDELPTDQVRRLAEARRAAVSFADVTDDPAALLAGVDESVLAPVQVAWRAHPGERSKLVDVVVEAVDARRVGLTLAPTSTQNLISADSEVRFAVRNDLPTAASVRVLATPRKACLRVSPSPAVVVPAGGEEVVPVAVHAIANCEVVVEAVLTSADGTALATPVTFVVRASPTIESVGTAVVGALLAVGLVLGVGRTIRRGQSARRGARRVHDEEATRPLPVLGGTPEGDA